MRIIEIVQSLPPGYKIYHRGKNLFEIRRFSRTVARVYGTDGLEFLASAMNGKRGQL